MSFHGIFRIRGGAQYDLFLDSLFNHGSKKPPDTYEFKTYADLDHMIEDLGRKIASNPPEKVALVASFTESDGRNSRIRVKTPEITWLMDEKTEYPEYWINQRDVLKKCASIYGAQGFEADYVGVIWGRDLVWRGSWVLVPEAITDAVGNNNSLKRLAVTNKEKAMKLLLNRYRILLTRGIKGTYVYFEDSETRDYISSRI